MKAPVKHHQGFICALFFTILTVPLPGVSIAKEFDAALQLLDRMGRAAESLNYQGVFVYLRNNQLKAVRVIHKADKEGEYERLVSLNGVPREIVRNNELVTCILPDDKAVLVDEHHYPKVVARGKNFHDNNGFSRRLPAKLKAMREHYRFSLGEPDRIAGRETQQVVIIPKDQYRYGYRLWVDNETGLLLKTMMVGEGEGERALEQMMFTSLLLPEEIPDTALVPAVTGREFSWREGEPLSVNAGDYESQWQVGWIPAGFTLVAHGRHLLPNGQVPVEHLVYSDGLSSVSIFIERIMHAQQGHLHGFSNMGAVNVYGAIQALHYLTVVGEVPHTTVKRMGKSIRYTGSDSD
ncbi:MucB/RseB family protein [Nitrosococcus halophilus Nc 4]|uniref:MucB/RseB family protein n=1 Tax=Nitrosococcus halophilus (strain Nc4) TaxID=472759 RepID=D5BX14_NITHN|nr:MucB/RseB C-terminal domain-containing protein [Nitrosococcus halophilus]ADE13895.1 MucB/RseB family protein [Nitrosococcus halophilus Nc 4]